MMDERMQVGTVEKVQQLHSRFQTPHRFVITRMNSDSMVIIYS